MKKFAFLAAAGLAASAFVSTPALAASAVEGSWAIEAKTDFGTFKSDWTVTEAADGVKLDIVDAPAEGAPVMESTISEVAIAGDVLTFKRSLKSDQGTFNLAYTVTASGNALTGQATSDFGPLPITGTRK